MKERHMARLLVSETILERIFHTSQPTEYYRVIPGIPEGAEYRGAAFDVERNCFVFYYEHPSFPLVAENQRITCDLAVEFEAHVHPVGEYDGR